MPTGYGSGPYGSGPYGVTVDPLSDALGSATGTWVPTQVHADWRNDGYDGDNTIDDLTPLVGTGINVHQALDDGMPSDVTYTSGSDSTSSATVTVGGSGGLRPNQYWSQDNSSSPISGFDRDVAPVVISPGVVTATGIQRTTVFTGQMSDASISGQDVTVSAVSKTRLALTKRIQPPPIIGDSVGLTATWPVSYALAKCGLYASPPPRTGCRAWLPMHGSMHPVIPDDPTLDVVGNGAQDLRNPAFPSVRPTFVTGPFVTGAYAAVGESVGIQLEANGIRFTPGTDILSQAANAGRIEMWMRGDVATVNTSWGASGFLGDNLLTLDVTNSNSTEVLFGVTASTRKPYITAFDGTHTVTLTSTAAIPSDGNWYFVGAAWDFTGKKLWVASNATVNSTGASTLTTSGLPATDNFDPFSGGDVSLDSWLPVAEVQITGGAQANADNFPWVNNAAYWSTTQSGAIISPSINTLVALAEPVPLEAAALIGKFAQAELAQTRTDELDRFCYLPLPYWAQTAQQTQVGTVSTSTNAGTDLAITRDLTRIRNQVVVNYTDTRVNLSLAGIFADAAISFNTYTLPPGITKISLPFNTPVVATNDTDAYYLITAADVTAGAGPATQSFLCANTASNGTGSFATTGQIIAKITSWNAGSATLTVQNTTGTTYYTVNSGIVPYIDVKGLLATTSDQAVTVQDDANVAARGVRGMSTDQPGIQTADFANFIAAELAARLKKAKREVTVTVRGDPRRQPGDLVRLQDPTGTAIDGMWRALVVDHNINGANYTQTLTLVEAALIGVWDQSLWDDGSIWGA